MDKSINNDSVYLSLSTELRICDIGGLFVAIYKDVDYVDYVVNQLKIDLSNQFIFEINIDSNKIWFPNFFEQMFEQIGLSSNVFNLLGIELLSAEDQTIFLKHLQLAREQFKPLPYSIVFWITADFEKRMFYESPDFHHYVFRVFDFSNQVDLKAKSKTQKKYINYIKANTKKKIKDYLRQVVWQYDNWQYIKENKPQDFLFEVMSRADLKKFYIESTYTDESNKTRLKLSTLIDSFMSDDSNHFLTLLGDFGIGKTSFSFQYFIYLARNFINNETDRIPIFVSLKDFKKQIDLESLILVSFYKKYNIDLSLSVFLDYSLHGNFVFFLDGFDEMTFVSKNQNANTTFSELVKLTFENVLFLTKRTSEILHPNKVILTSRKHFFLSQIQEEAIIQKASPATFLKYAYKKNFKVARYYINEFDNEQIREYINKKYSNIDDQESFYNIIDSVYDLRELAGTPLLLELINRTFPKLKIKKSINTADIYMEYTSIWIDLHDDRSVMTKDGKLKLLLDLSSKMFTRGGDHSINYRELDPPDRCCLKNDQKQQDDEDYYRYDLTTCSFLNRDSEGNYRFQHRSFMEFFVALKLYYNLNIIIRESNKSKNKIEKNNAIQNFLDDIWKSKAKYEGKLPEYLIEINNRYYNTKTNREMIYVPAGPYVKKCHNNIYLSGTEKNCFIDKFPVTNHDFSFFIEDNGYKNKKWWTNEGLDFLKTTSFEQPRYWLDNRRNQHDCPVVGISFFEAEAYAKWCNTRLPTEKIWEKAANGIDGRLFPWGNDYPDDTRCNFNFSNKHTTPVTKYRLGRSLLGVFDQLGNVWEWVCEYASENKIERIVRGGSFTSNMYDFKNHYRHRYSPFERNYALGFRVSLECN